MDWLCLPCNVPSNVLLFLSLSISLFIYLFPRIMFHLVFAGGAALTIFRSSYCPRAKGKWRILSVQTLMLQKAFNSTNWAHMRRSCQPELLSHANHWWWGGKRQMPLLYIYTQRRDTRETRSPSQIQSTAVISAKWLICLNVSDQFQPVFATIQFNLVHWHLRPTIHRHCLSETQREKHLNRNKRWTSANQVAESSADGWPGRRGEKQKQFQLIVPQLTWS